MSRLLLLDVVGTAAGVCSMTSFVPQIAKILRERHAEQVSLRMYVVTVTGFVLWTTYGVLLGSWPVWASNAVNLLMAGTVLALKWRFGLERRRAGAAAGVDFPLGASKTPSLPDSDQCRRRSRPSVSA